MWVPGRNADDETDRQTDTLVHKQHAHNNTILAYYKQSNYAQPNCLWYLYTVLQKSNVMFYFLNNSVRNEPILVYRIVEKLYPRTINLCTSPVKSGHCTLEIYTVNFCTLAKMIKIGLFLTELCRQIIKQ